MSEARKKSVAIDWINGVPQVDHLTGNEAKGALRSVLLKLEAAEGQRRLVSQALVALVHRDALRGVLLPDGRMVLDDQPRGGRLRDDRRRPHADARAAAAQGDRVSRPRVRST